MEAPVPIYLEPITNKTSQVFRLTISSVLLYTYILYSAFGGGIFGTGNQPSTTGTTQPSTGLFGQNLGQSTTQTAPGANAFGGTSIFGQKPATATFGQSTAQPAPTGLGTSLFGTSTLGGAGGTLGQSTIGGTQGPGTLTASVAQPVQENLPIFSLLRDSSQAASIAPPPKKTSNFFVDIPTRSALGISSARLTNGGKLRGFGVSQSAAGLNRTSRLNGLGSSMALSRGTGSLSLSRSDSKSLLGPDSFTKGPSLGSGTTSSPKKLVLNKKVDPSEFFGRSIAKSIASGGGGKVEFSPTMSMAAREKEVHATPQVLRPTQPVAGAAPSPVRRTTTLEKGKESSELQDGDYYLEPPLEVLRKLSNQELSSYQGLVVGRKGVGKIEFLEPVDLTALPRLDDLLGKIVIIEKGEVIVYPDTLYPQEERPARGSGINVQGLVTLYDCWPRDKATGGDLRDPKATKFVRHKERLAKTDRKSNV